jgi:hypothetical protein
MKTTLKLGALLLLVNLNSQLSTSLAQGSLTPPAGAPAPVMKSLDQVEARTPLVAGQPGVSVAADGSITITQPGSYYLTKNLTIINTNNGINVGFQSATIDLNGFVISGTVGVALNYGVLVSGSAGQSVTIRNGHIVGGGTNAGFSGGIYLQNGVYGDVLVEDVHVSNVRAHGIYLNVNQARNIVRNCSVENAASGVGIVADVVTGCTVRDTKLDGIYAASVSDCTVIQKWGTGDAINALSNSQNGSVLNSTGQSYGGNGISARNVSNSFGSSVTGTAGIVTTTANICTGDRPGGTAISAFVAIGCTAVTGTNAIVNKYNMP